MLRFRLSKAKDREERAQLRRSAELAEQNPVMVEDPSYLPGVHGRLNVQDIVALRRLRLGLERGRGRLRSGPLARLLARVFGLRRLEARAERSAERDETAKEEHRDAEKDASEWESELGPRLLVPVLAIVFVWALAAAGGLGDGIFSAGAAEYLVATVSFLPGGADTPIAILLAVFLGVSALVLTKFAVEELLLIRRRGHKGPGVEIPDVRSNAGHVLRAVLALGAVTLILAMGIALRVSGQQVRSQSGAQPVSSQSIGAEASPSKGEEGAKHDDTLAFLALGLAPLVVLAAITLLTQDVARIWAKRLRAEERRKRLRAAHRGWRHRVADNLVEAARDRDAELLRAYHVRATEHRATTAERLITTREGSPGLMGNIGPAGQTPDSMRDPELSMNGDDPIPGPVERYRPPPPEDGAGNGGPTR